MISAGFVERHRDALVPVERGSRRPEIAPHDAKLIVGVRPGHDAACLDHNEHGHSPK